MSSRALHDIDGLLHHLEMEIRGIEDRERFLIRMVDAESITHAERDAIFMRLSRQSKLLFTKRREYAARCLQYEEHLRKAHEDAPELVR